MTDKKIWAIVFNATIAITSTILFSTAKSESSLILSTISYIFALLFLFYLCFIENENNS